MAIVAGVMILGLDFLALEDLTTDRSNSLLPEIIILIVTLPLLILIYKKFLADIK